MEGPDGKDQLLSNRKYNIPVHVCHISKRGKNWIDTKKRWRLMKPTRISFNTKPYPPITVKKMKELSLYLDVWIQTIASSIYWFQGVFSFFSIENYRIPHPSSETVPVLDISFYNKWVMSQTTSCIDLKAVEMLTSVSPDKKTNIDTVYMYISVCWGNSWVSQADTVHTKRVLKRRLRSNRVANLFCLLLSATTIKRQQRLAERDKR